MVILNIQKLMVLLLVGMLVLPLSALAQNTTQGTVQTASQAASAGPSVTVEGVPFEREIQLAGTTLKLNGVGVRTRFVFKVYAAALYLQVPSATSTDVYMSKSPKRLKVSFLREIDSTTLGKTMSQVMSDNLPREQFGKCIPGIVKLGELFAEKKKMTAGEMFTIDEIPGKGTVISINSKMAAEISEPEFFTCLMHNYFGDRPADAKLKTALLGGS